MQKHRKIAHHHSHQSKIGLSYTAATKTKYFFYFTFYIFFIVEAPYKKIRYDVNMTVGPHGPHGSHGGLHAITPPRNDPHAYKIPNRNAGRGRVVSPPRGVVPDRPPVPSVGGAVGTAARRPAPAGQLVIVIGELEAASWAALRLQGKKMMIKMNQLMDLMSLI